MSKSFWSTTALKHSSFRWFYFGRTISLFGSGMTPVALAFAVLQAPHGEHLLGYILAAELLPNILMVLIGGSVADRYRRDRLIQFANLGSGFSQAGIALIVLQGISPLWIFPLAILNGILGAFTSPATRGIVPELVDREHLKQANTLMNVSRSSAKIAGPAVAGVLVATIGGGWGIAIDAATFFVSAAFMSRIHIPSFPPISSTSLIKQLHEGWSYFRQQPWIWSNTGAWSMMNAIQMGAWQVLGPIIAKRTFGATGWGLTLSAKAIGLLIASGLLLRLSYSRPLRDAMISATFIGIPMIILGRNMPLSYLIAAAIVAGMGSTVSQIAWDTSLQQGVPEDKRSRIMAFDDFGAYIMIPLGEIVALPLADAWGFDRIETWSGILFILVALLPLTLTSVRRMTVHDIESLSRAPSPPSEP